MQFSAFCFARIVYFVQINLCLAAHMFSSSNLLLWIGMTFRLSNSTSHYSHTISHEYFTFYNWYTTYVGHGKKSVED